MVKVFASVLTSIVAVAAAALLAPRIVQSPVSLVLKNPVAEPFSSTSSPTDPPDEAAPPSFNVINLSSMSKFVVVIVVVVPETVRSPVIVAEPPKDTSPVDVTPANVTASVVSTS